MNGFKLYLFFIFVISCFISVSFLPAQGAVSKDSSQRGGSNMEFNLSSPAFEAGERIPEKYTCDGKDISIPLKWIHSPENTESFALIVEDPDAPGQTWVHWVIYDIPSGVNELSENVEKEKSKLSGELSGALQGLNSWGAIGYGGPCPPGSNPHRYFFRMYALDTLINEQNIDKNELLKAMENHILEQTELVGTYSR